MANEGSTKPTYSELETSLARVRGLLQRYGRHDEGCKNHPMKYTKKACDCGLEAALVPQGAESADIGKLDTADKKAHES